MPQIKPQVKFRVKPGLVEYPKRVIDNSCMTSALGKTIKQRLKSLGKTQGWLAEEAGVSNTAVTKWIANGRISREKSVSVAEILGLSLDEFLIEGADHAARKAENQSLSLVYVDEAELKLLTGYREATATGKQLIRIAIESAPKSESLELLTRANKHK
jgi:transcriptional regulator with XRE-family HTH domain